MFDKDMQIHGKHAAYWKDLSQTPGNAADSKKHFKIFENYIYVYMVAPIIGMLYGRKGAYDPNDDTRDTAGMLAEIQIKNASKLKYIYRLIILCDDTLGLSENEKIDLAFREDNNADAVRKGMDLYTSYFFGGLEVLHEEFVDNCITDDDYIRKLFEFVSEFKEEHGIDDGDIDISQLLKG